MAEPCAWCSLIISQIHTSLRLPEVVLGAFAVEVEHLDSHRLHCCREAQKILQLGGPDSPVPAPPTGMVVRVICSLLSWISVSLSRAVCAQIDRSHWGVTKPSANPSLAETESLASLGSNTV